MEHIVTPPLISALLQRGYAGILFARLCGLYINIRIKDGLKAEKTLYYS